jgi:hypothetical protein
LPSAGSTNFLTSSFQEKTKSIRRLRRGGYSGTAGAGVKSIV